MIFVICIVFYVAVLLKQYRSISKSPRRVHLKVWNKAWFNSIKIIYFRRKNKQRAINKTIFIQTVLTRKIGGDLLSLGDFGLCSYVVEQHLKLSLIKLIILSKFLSVFLRNEGENTRSVYPDCLTCCMFYYERETNQLCIFVWIKNDFYLRCFIEININYSTVILKFPSFWMWIFSCLNTRNASFSSEVKVFVFEQLFLMRFIIDLTLLSISLWWTFAVFPSSIYKHCIRHYGHSTDQSSYNRWIARETGTYSEFFPPRDQNLCLVILLCECNKFKFSPGGISHFVDPSMEKYLKDHILIAVISIEFETYINISFNFH